MKNMKIRTKILVAIIMLDILILASLGAGYITVYYIDTHLTATETVHGMIRSYEVFALILFVVDLVIGLGVSISLPRIIKTNIDNFSKAAKEMARGNVNLHLEKKNNDEFGQLSDEVQNILDGMRVQAQIAARVAEGDFTADFPERSDVDELAMTLNLLTRRNSEAISEIKESSVQVKTSASQVASASEALAQGSTEQASAIQQITASIEDVAEKTKQNATEANEASELITEVMSDVKLGNARMREMMEAMEGIDKASESISKIIKVIDDIAFQTNILALNAAVEAARAGEAGKGFSVVAEEVRSLAAKSAEAAAETAELIENSIAKVNVGSKIADETATALEQITAAVEKSEEIIVGIAQSSNYQATAIAQIDQAVNQVSQVVQTNSATSEECAAASEELFNQANAVLDLLCIYKLKDSVDDRRISVVDHNRMAEKEAAISLGDGFGKY